MDRSRIAVLVLEHDALEPVQDALAPVGDGGGMIPEPGPLAERFHAVNIQRVSQEGGEHAHRIAAAAHAGAHRVRKKPRHFHELLPGFHADAHLEIAHHLREGVGAYHGTDAVNGILITVQVGIKGGIHGFLQALEAVRDGHHLGAQDFHAGDVGGLLGNVHRSHVNLTLQAEEGGSRSQGHAMLPGARFRNDAFLAHVFGEKAFTHAVVQLVGARMVQVFPFQVNLGSAQVAGKAFAVVNRGGASLELLADAAQFIDELGGVGYRLVGFRNFFKGGNKLVRQVNAAVFAKTALGVRKIA